MEDTYGTNEVNSLRIQNLWERLIFYLIVFFFPSMTPSVIQMSVFTHSSVCGISLFPLLSFTRMPFQAGLEA